MYGTECGATRRPRVPFPKSTSKEPAKAGGLQTERWPREKGRNGGRESNRLTAARAHLQKVNQSSREVLGLASRQSKMEKCRYVQLAKLDIPPDCIALLDTVCNLVPCPPAIKQKTNYFTSKFPTLKELVFAREKRFGAKRILY